jgi:hypothetical protein
LWGSRSRCRLESTEMEERSEEREGIDGVLPDLEAGGGQVDRESSVR